MGHRSATYFPGIRCPRMKPLVQPAFYAASPQLPSHGLRAEEGACGMGQGQGPPCVVREAQAVMGGLMLSLWDRGQGPQKERSTQRGGQNPFCLHQHSTLWVTYEPRMEKGTLLVFLFSFFPLGPRPHVCLSPALLRYN